MAVSAAAYNELCELVRGWMDSHSVSRAETCGELHEIADDLNDDDPAPQARTCRQCGLRYTGADEQFCCDYCKGAWERATDQVEQQSP
jgi:hypothetical protein